MNGRGQSDRLIVPRKRANKAETAMGATLGRSLNGHEGGNAGDSQERAYGGGSGAVEAAERVEGRGLAKRNSAKQGGVRTQGRGAPNSELDRIHQAARRDRGRRFTALWHHVYDVERLRAAYDSLRREAAAGVDGETWRSYGRELGGNLRCLSERLRRGGYRAKPVKRRHIPKPDGRKRPIGITALEDKIVQKATVAVLEEIYEADFKGFSYGSRRGRNQHRALDALWVGLMSRKVNWVLDTDIRGFFDAIRHEWMVRFVEHRIGDRRVIRHVKKWLNAGVLEDGRLKQVEQGTPQGGCISPLLGNVYLHYVFDLWAERWRKREARGEVILVRYADDIRAGFQYREDAVRFLAAMQERIGKFGLELHPEKTRVLEFGRYAQERRARRGKGRPSTFTFLGFVHACGKTADGGFMVRRKPDPQRMREKLREIKEEIRRKVRMPVPRQGAWLRSVVQGYYNYFAVPGTTETLNAFRRAVVWSWYRALRRRSQRTRLTWERMLRLTKRWLPVPRITHPNPFERLCV